MFDPVYEQESITLPNFFDSTLKQGLSQDKCLQPKAQSVPLQPPGEPIVTILTRYLRTALSLLRVQDAAKALQSAGRIDLRWRKNRLNSASTASALCDST